MNAGDSGWLIDQKGCWTNRCPKQYRPFYRAFGTNVVVPGPPDSCNLTDSHCGAVRTRRRSRLGTGRQEQRGPACRVAWALEDKTVIRGGYGIYFPTSAAQGIRDPISTNGFNQALTKEDDVNSLPINPPLQPWPTPMTGGDVVLYSSAFSINAVPVGLRAPLVQQYNATFERQIGLKTAVRFLIWGRRLMV